MQRRDILRAGISLGILGAFRNVSAAGGEVAPAIQGATIDDAFYYAFPLTNSRAPNRNGPARSTASPARSIGSRIARCSRSHQPAGPAPNNDTIYSSSFMELAAGPLEVPRHRARPLLLGGVHERVHRQLRLIGTRATKGRGGRYWIAGPSGPARPRPASPSAVRPTTSGC